MSIISHRACHLVGSSNEDINKFVAEMQNFLNEKKVPEDYAINVYKDAVACCGYMPMGVTVEITGPKDQQIQNLDSMIYSKIIELCEREKIEHHECSPLETLDLDK